MKTSKTTGDKKDMKTGKLELTKETVRSLRVRSEIQTGILLGVSSVPHSCKPPTMIGNCL